MRSAQTCEADTTAREADTKRRTQQQKYQHTLAHSGRNCPGTENVCVCVCIPAAVVSLICLFNSKPTQHRCETAWHLLEPHTPHTRVKHTHTHSLWQCRIHFDRVEQNFNTQRQRRCVL